MSGQLNSAALVSGTTDQSESSIPEILVINRQTNRKTTVDPRMSMLIFSTSSIHSCSGHLFLFLPPSPPPQKHKMTGRTGFPGPPTPTSWTCECVCVRIFIYIALSPTTVSRVNAMTDSFWVVVQLCMKTNYRATTKRL